jgi:hypothetical protein
MTTSGALYFTHVETRRFLIWSWEVGIVNIKIERSDHTQFRPKGGPQEWREIGKWYKLYKCLKEVVVYYEIKNKSNSTITRRRLCKL